MTKIGHKTLHSMNGRVIVVTGNKEEEEAAAALCGQMSKNSSLHPSLPACLWI